MSNPRQHPLYEHYKTLLSAAVNEDSSSDIVDQITTSISDLNQSGDTSKADDRVYYLWEALGDFLTSPNICLDNTSGSVNHEGIVSLVRLVQQLKSQGTTSQSESDHNRKFDWSHLPGLGMALREKWNDAPPQSNTTQWVALNAFTARLTSQEVYDMSLYAIWAFRGALESPFPSSSNQDAVLAWQSEVLAVSLGWIEEAATQMVKLSKSELRFEYGGNQGDRAKAGPALEKWFDEQGSTEYVHGFSVLRLKFWLQRLKEIANGDDKSLRQPAQRAFDKLQAALEDAGDS